MHRHALIIDWPEPDVFVTFIVNVRFLMAMPAYVASQRALACKLLTNFPANSGRNKATHMATILLFDEETGTVQAVSTCHLVAQLRT